MCIVNQKYTQPIGWCDLQLWASANLQGQYTVQQQPAPYPQGQLPMQGAFYPQSGYEYPQQGGYSYPTPPGYYQQPVPPPQ